ncbi:MAG TPA: hypothetical protein PKE30_00265 [Niabella sp.]|nr:hypothetical protein [Niabella sp.]
MDHKSHDKKRMRNQSILMILTFSLLLLWIPVSMEKILHFESFEKSMFKQPFPVWFIKPVSILLPIAEVLTAILLVFRKTRLLGFYFSFGLMLAFTGFVGMALMGMLKNALCNCATIINGMSWKAHFFFNLLFLIISAYGIYLLKNNEALTIGDGKRQGLVGQKTV